MTVVGEVVDGEHVLGVSDAGAFVGSVVGSDDVGSFVAVRDALGLDDGDAVDGVELGTELGTELGQELGDNVGSSSLSIRLLLLLTSLIRNAEDRTFCWLSILWLVSTLSLKVAKTG